MHLWQKLQSSKKVLFRLCCSERKHVEISLRPWHRQRFFGWDTETLNHKGKKINTLDPFKISESQKSPLRK